MAFMTSPIARGKALRLVFAVLALASAGWSQERGPLSLPNIEELLRGGVSHEGIGQLIKDRGINFEATEAVKNRLSKAGAGSAVIEAVERAGAEFTKRSQEARRLAEAKQRTESLQATEEARKK